MTWFGRPTRKVQIRRVGAYSASLSALWRFGGSPPPRPQQAPRPAVVQQQPAASSSSDPAPAYLQQAALAARRVTLRLGRRRLLCLLLRTRFPRLLLQLRGPPDVRPSRAFRTCQPAAPLCLRHRLSSILRLGSDSVRDILVGMVLAGATPTASSVTASVTIRPAWLSVRGRTNL